MGRAPCCEKMGLKKGPWNPEEDLILINHINTFGHKNWRALPKQAGLLRCGKSCRLRWNNYLRPDIKRGNFTREEEDIIIKLHDMLGNRWSAIAARLPGRTDNEIKNVWHTHLKKKLPQQHTQNDDKKRNAKQMQLELGAQNSNPNKQDPIQEQEQEPVNFPTHHVMIKAESTDERPLTSPQCSSSDMSALTTRDTIEHNSRSLIISTTINNDMSINNSVETMFDDFWSEVLSADDNSDETSSFPDIGDAELKFPFPFSPPLTEGEVHLASSSSISNGMDFWYDVFMRAEELPEL